MALLVVLGLLGLLLISAVGFSVLMRTERSAATNYRHTSSARQILFAALNRAIEDLDTDIGDDLNPNWTDDPFYLGRAQRMVRNPEKILFSYYDNEAGNEEPVFARILTKDVMTYVPALFHRRLNELDNSYDTDVASDNPSADSSCHPEWVPIKHEGSVVGRYAYAILDTSGLLDASLVHDKNVSRWTGGSMREVRIDPEIVSAKDIVSVANFTADRESDGRYETIAELASLNTGLSPAKLSNFEVFSTYSTNTWTNTPPVNLYGSDADIQAKRTEILKAFEKSGIPTSLTADTLWKKSDVAFAALMDYVDTDSVMYPLSNVDIKRFHRPCTEQLPLVNSFGISMQHSRSPVANTDPVRYKHTVKYQFRLNVVTWPMKKDGQFRVRGGIYVNNINAGSTTAPVLDYNLSPTANNMERFLIDDFPDLLGDIGVGEQNLFADEIEVTAEIPGDVGDKTPKLDFDVYYAVEIYNKDDNQLCYQFPGDKTPNQLLGGGQPSGDVQDWGWARINVNGVKPEYEMTLTSSGPADWIHVWAECIDPRWGYAYPGNLTGTKPMWYTNKKQPGTALLSSVNGYAPPLPPAAYNPTKSLQDALLKDTVIAEAVGLVKENVDGFHDPRFGSDGNEYDHISMQRRMYVANAPLQTPGELAYLLFGPWETVKLYDRYPATNNGNDYHKVLDFFEVRDPAAVPKGKVNINTATEDVLSLLFLDMPLRSEKSRGSALDELAAVQKAFGPGYPPKVLGKKLHTEILNKVAASGKPIDKLSDLACVYANVGAPAGVPDINNPNPVSVVWNRCAASPTIRFGEFEREAVIRNVANLLTTKQQLFTIILRADAFTTRFGSDRLKDGTVLSSATGVAQVYRDPLPTKDASGHVYHKTTVRMLKILE